MDIDSSNNSLSQVINVYDITVPLSKFNVAAGSTITISGGPIMFESNKPLECMTLKYTKEADTTYNYFSCKTCKYNCKFMILSY